MTHNGRNVRPNRMRNPLEPADEEQINIEGEDGTIISRELTMAERYLRAHIQRYQETIDENDSQSRSNNRRNRIYVTEYTENEENGASRIKILSHLCLFLILGILILSVILEEADDADIFPNGANPNGEILENDTNLRIRPPDGGEWFQNITPVTVHYSGLLDNTSNQFRDDDYKVRFTLESSGSNIPGVRLSTLRLHIEPPINVPYYDKDVVKTVDADIDIESVYSPDSTNKFNKNLDQNTLDSMPHIRVLDMETQGLHMYEDNQMIFTGKNARGVLYKPVIMDDYASLTDEQRLDQIYELYSHMARKECHGRANYYQDVMTLSYPDGRYSTRSHSLGYKECDFIVRAEADAMWSKSILSAGGANLTSAPALSDASGHSLINTRVLEKSLIKEGRIHKPSAILYGHSRWLQSVEEDEPKDDIEKGSIEEIENSENNEVTQSKDEEVVQTDNEEVDVTDGSVTNAVKENVTDGSNIDVTSDPDDISGSLMKLEIISIECPEFNMTITGRALNMVKLSNLFAYLLYAFAVLIIFEAIGTLRFLWSLENDENRNSRIKVSIPNLVVHILVSGFEAGTLFSYGMESALYAASFVIASIMRSLVSIVLLIRIATLCWRLQMTRRIEELRNDGALNTNSQLTEACRREAHSFVRLLTASSSGGLLVLQKVFSIIPEVFVILYWFLWTPQIYFNLKHGHQRSLSKVFVLSLSLSRLYLPFIVWALPSAEDNMNSQYRTPFDAVLLPAIPRTPNIALWIIVLTGVALPASILILEHYLGARWFVPVKYLPELYDYKTAPVVDKNKLWEIYKNEGRPATDTDVRIGRTGLREAAKDIVYSTTYSWKDYLYSTLKQWMNIGTNLSNDTMTDKELQMEELNLEDIEQRDTIPILTDDNIDDELLADIHADTGPGPSYEVECVICMAKVIVPLEDCKDANETEAPMQTALGQYLPLFLYMRMNRKIEPITRTAEDGEDTWALAPCDHIFHEGCLREWLEVKMECPTCRRAIPLFVD